MALSTTGTQLIVLALPLVGPQPPAKQSQIERLDEASGGVVLQSASIPSPTKQYQIERLDETQPKLDERPWLTKSKPGIVRARKPNSSRKQTPTTITNANPEKSCYIANVVKRKKQRNKKNNMYD